MQQALLFILSLLLTAAALLLLRQLAPRMGLLDHPDQRKHHQGAIPVIGGVALYLVLLLLFVSGVATDSHVITLLMVMTLVTGIGVLDDRQGVSSRVRLLVQLIAVLLLVYGADLRLVHLGAILPNGATLQLGALATAVTLFGIMSVINALNFIDGLDGLAGGLALIACTGLWLIFVLSGKNPPDLIPVLSGGLVAFLLFNARWLGRKRASLFLGDAGSTLLGLLLAWLMVEHSQGSSPAISPVIALWLLAIPLSDFLAIILRRISLGRSPLHSDREHLHHILMRAGHSEQGTVVLIHLSAIFLAAIGILGQLYHWPQTLLFYSFLALFVLSLGLLRHSWRIAKLLRRLEG